MKYIIENIKIACTQESYRMDLIKAQLQTKYGITSNDIININLIKESIDARRKKEIYLIYSVSIETNLNLDKFKFKTPIDLKHNIEYGTNKLEKRPIIIGAGPSGLFCAWLLSKYNYKPIIIERGSRIEDRVLKVKNYWEKGILDTESNVQFGEGGAGTFSDGKLTTRISDPNCKNILEILVQNGAPEEILYKSKPHIGTDKLRKVIINMRKEIIQNGGEFWFDTKLESININNNSIKSIILNNKTEIETDILILAIGHSSRDTFEMLFKKEIFLSQKPFSMGVRIEHLKDDVDFCQYGNKNISSILGAADYQLSHRIGNRTAYSFCMCPGGIVVAGSSEENSIVTNGMSEYSRNRENSNSAYVVNVDTSDFASNSPLSGIDLQRELERLPYKVCNKSNCAPIQRLKDFLEDKKTNTLGKIKPSYSGETFFSNLNDYLPKFISDTLKSSIDPFGKKMNFFKDDDAILTGFETRTSSPVRINRNENYESINCNGIFPIGEGAGYAGGIISAAVDGLKISENIIKNNIPKY